MNEYDYKALMPDDKFLAENGLQKADALLKYLSEEYYTACCLGNLMFSNMKRKNQERLNETLRDYIDRALIKRQDLR